MTPGYSGAPSPRSSGSKTAPASSPSTRPSRGYQGWLKGCPKTTTFSTKLGSVGCRGARVSHAAIGTGADAKSVRTKLATDGFIWVSWPKRSSGVPTDITEDTIRDVALPLGFVDVKVCAVTDTWSGLKLVIRRSERT